MKTVSTKKTLLASVFAMLLCVSMFVGSTFAWFTSTATTSVNTIQAGNLKVELLAADGKSPLGDSLKWVKAAGAEDEDVLWEPGCSYNLEGFRIKNGGNLALKYKVVISGLTGSAKLLEAIDFTVKMGGDTVALEGWEGKLGADDITDVITITGTMRTDAGNDYMNEKIENISITVVATQDAVESDSNGSDYDKDAEYRYPDVSYVTVPAGDETTVNESVKDALANAVTSDTTGEQKSTQIILPANTTVTVNSGATKVPQGKTKDIVISGDKTTTVKLENTNPGSEGSLSYQDGANLTFKGVTVDAGDIKGICARGGVVSFIGCTFKSELKQTIASKFVFTGCTFEEPVSQVGYGCKDVVFEDCKFNTDGYGIKIYSEGSTPVNLTVKNCAFKNTGSAAKSAIFLDHIIDGITYNITVDTCTFDGFTAEPTPNYNKWATRIIVADSFVKTADGQYVFSYQTGEESGNYHKILTAEQLVVTVK